MSRQDFVLPIINPLPYIKEADVDHKLRTYLSDPRTNLAVENRAKEIKKRLLTDVDRIATELALFEVVVIKADPITHKIDTLKPSSICWAQ